MPSPLARQRRPGRGLGAWLTSLALVAGGLALAFASAGNEDEAAPPAGPGLAAVPSGHLKISTCPGAPGLAQSPSQPRSSGLGGGRILSKESFESANFDGWYLQSLSSRAAAHPADPFEGDLAARFEVREADEEPDTGSQRSEVLGPTFEEGQDIYIRDAIRIPAGNTYEVPWQMIQQLHEVDWEDSPGIAVFLDERPTLRLGTGEGSPIFWQSATLETDRWYELVYRVYLSQDRHRGLVEVWLDGVHQKLANGETCMHGQTIQADETYIKAGIYRSLGSTGTSIVEHDAIAIGTSLAAVTAD
jgi:hypothetical protein